MLSREIFEIGIDDLLSVHKFKPQGWDDKKSKDLYFSRLQHTFPDDNSFGMVVIGFLEHDAFPTIKDFIEAAPANAPQIEKNWPLLENPDQINETDKEKRKRAANDLNFDLPAEICKSLDGMPNAEKPMDLNDKKSITMWLGHQLGYSSFASVSGSFEKDGAIAKLAHYFQIPYSYAKKWVYLSHNGYIRNRFQ